MAPEDIKAAKDAPDLRRMTYVPLCVCGVALLISYLGASFENLSMSYLSRQDRWLLVVAAAIALIAGWHVRDRAPMRLQVRWQAGAAALALIVLCYAGHRWLLSGYALSRDEQMVLFDASIFASGRLVAPLPPEWVQHVDALNTWFMLPIRQPAAWASSYLPMNAAIHAVVGTVADIALTGPLLVGIGALALHGCARKLWPADREAPLLALALYVGSGQIVFTGMTTYAMSAHLALDLVWLWLFLQRRLTADVAALAVGFVATGLHQPLFHPLFVGPVLALLLLERHWRRAALFALGYGAICVFWLLWPKWMQSLLVGPQSVVAPTGVDYFTRLLDTLRDWQAEGLLVMTLNVLRFLAWQHVLLLPLVIAAWSAIRRGGLPAALACGVVLILGVMLVVLPYQGHGFGYRYLHGVLGSLILLAVYGWLECARLHAALRTLVIRTTAAGLLVLLPLQAWMAHGLFAPYARVSAAIDRTGADFAIISEEDVHFAHDLVSNRPDLSNRPIRLIAEKVDATLIGQLCRTGPSVVFVSDVALLEAAAIFGIPPAGPAPKRNTALPPALSAAGCKVSVLR